MRDPAALAPDIRAHLEAENAYTAATLAPTEALQAAMFAEMRGRVKEDDSSLPSPDGPWAYAVRYEAGAQHPLHVRTPRDGGPEQVLLDEPKLSQGKPFFSVGGAQHSPDHGLYAYAVDEQGSEYFEIRTIDLTTGETRPQVVASSTGDFCWSPDGAWLFWVWRDENGRPAKVFRRAVGGAEDVLVYAEPDAGFFVHVGLTQSRAFIVIGSGDHETSECSLIAATPIPPPSRAWSSRARRACAIQLSTGPPRATPVGSWC